MKYFLDVNDVMQLLGVSNRGVWYYTNSGQLRHLRLPGCNVTRWHAAGLVAEGAPLPDHGIWGIADVRDALQVSQALTYRLAREGHLPLTKRLGRWSVNTRRMRSWVQRHSEGEHDPDVLDRRGLVVRRCYFEVDLDTPDAATVVERGGGR